MHNPNDIWARICAGNVVYWRSKPNEPKSRHPFVVVGKHVDGEEQTLLLVQTTSQKQNYRGRYDIVDISGNKISHPAITRPCCALAYEFHALPLSRFLEIWEAEDKLEPGYSLVEVNPHQKLATPIVREICNILIETEAIERKYKSILREYLDLTITQIPVQRARKLISA